ncbi:Golgi SNAP receptor complex member 1-2 [Hibiscus syriacus]|uniref:Golgi SNAP receptor complex member 1-2 n=1 Tax=Hibiscus syriacus TaxID=106335 RepID=A0A6A3AXZ8_HIBSY|nr:Golgi SNAP receptor complex member 1-2 [Hibiscus syriacus]
MTDPNLDLQESGWEELRREARKIEGDLDVKLSSYAKLGARSWKSMEMEIQSSLEKLLDINDSMSRCAASAASTTSVTQKLARHKDILHEFTQEFRRIKGNINSMREHAELLSSVRDDINEYKTSGSMSPRMQLLRERAAIHGSIAHIDDVINQAQTTRAVLGSQRALFGDVQGKVKVLGDKFPVIRGLLGSIGRRRSRDTLILSALLFGAITWKKSHLFDVQICYIAPIQRLGVVKEWWVACGAPMLGQFQLWSLSLRVWSKDLLAVPCCKGHWLFNSRECLFLDSIRCYQHSGEVA